MVAVAGCGGTDAEPYVVMLSTAEETPLALPLVPTHPTDVTGAASFTYTISDGSLSATARVNVTVN